MFGIRRPSQDELLRARVFRVLENQPDAPELLRLIEN
jgi:hypothetical protein